MAKVAKGATAQTMGHLSANLKVDGADLVKRIKGVIVFDIGGHKWTLDLTSGTGSLTDGVPDGVEPDLTLTANDDNFAKLVSGQLNPQQAFLFRKLKINGSMGMALKLTPVLSAARPASKL